jgi:hypothetical protein
LKNASPNFSCLNQLKDLKPAFFRVKPPFCKVQSVKNPPFCRDFAQPSCWLSSIPLFSREIQELTESGRWSLTKGGKCDSVADVERELFRKSMVHNRYNRNTYLYPLLS